MEDILSLISEAINGLHGIQFDNLSISDIVLIVLLVGEVVVNITPSEKDNSIFNKVKLIIRKIPFLKDRRKEQKK